MTSNKITTIRTLFLIVLQSNITIKRYNTYEKQFDSERKVPSLKFKSGDQRMRLLSTYYSLSAILYRRSGPKFDRTSD